MGCLCCRNREKPVDKEVPQSAQTPQTSCLTEPPDMRKPISRSVVKLEASLSFEFDEISSNSLTSSNVASEQMISSDSKETSFRANVSSGNRLEGIRVVFGGAECCYLLKKEKVGNLVKAEHRDTRKKCWVQTIELKQKTKGTGVKQLTRLRSLNHPNVLKLLDLFQDDKSLYVVYEDTEGGSAQELSESARGVSEPWAAAIMRQIFTAVSHCHSEGLVLKSLSLQHVLFTELPIEDCVCVKLLIPLEEKLGQSSPYIAPELKCKKHLGPVNDLWSCGIILSSLISGQCVFLNMQASFTSQEFRRAYTKWSDVSKPVKSLTLALIARNYHKRPTPEQCLQHSWIS